MKNKAERFPDTDRIAPARCVANAGLNRFPKTRWSLGMIEQTLSRMEAQHAPQNERCNAADAQRSKLLNRSGGFAKFRTGDNPAPAAQSLGD
jgi:hypothetical protein